MKNHAPSPEEEGKKRGVSMETSKAGTTEKCFNGLSILIKIQ